MNAPQARDQRLIRYYELAVDLYPAGFRQRNREPMVRTFSDAVEDGAIARRALIGLTLKDLFTSLVKEHLTMVRDTLARPVIVYNALVLAALSTGLALALYAIPQQVLRQGANDPQIQMATDLAATLGQYGATDGLLQGALMQNRGVVDMAKSLSPFLIVYDDNGHALGSNAQLNGQTPALPKGVLDYVRTHGEERVTWEPIAHSHAVRIAAVVERVNGAQPGFVVAGRSMREVEARTAQVSLMARVTWLGMLGVILLGTAVFGWYTRPQTV